MDKLEITFLGTGTSTGIPIVGCSCQVCRSDDQKNKRYRSSILITYQGKKILVDATPDLRTQLLRENIKNIDALFLTHTHADHVHGIDDLRPYCFIHQKTIPVYTNHFYSQELIKRFAYIFDSNYLSNKKIVTGGIPKLELKDIAQNSNIEGLDFTFFSLPHGHIESIGFKVEKIAYLIDCNEIPESVLSQLENELDVLIIDCVRLKPHGTHLHLDKTLSYIKRIKPKRTYLTHLGHDFDHQKLQAQVDKENMNINVSFDGLKIHSDLI